MASCRVWGSAGGGGESGRASADVVRNGVVAQHLCHRDAEVGEDLRLAAPLRRPMLGERAPCGDRRLVAPEGQRDVLAGRRDALEPFDRDEAVDTLQIGRASCRDRVCQYGYI